MARATPKITGYGFNGMSNVRRTVAYLLDELRRLTPQVVLNAEVHDDGVVKRRRGYRKIISLERVHSLWAGSIMLAVAQGVLYRIEGETALALGEVGGPPEAPMEYAEAQGRVFMSNGHWCGILDVQRNSLDSWGLPLPPAPDPALTDGNLPPGSYKVCYTYFREPDRISGNGPIAEIAWDGGKAGIKLRNLPSGALVWATQPNGSELFLASVDGGVISEAYYTQPLLSFGVTPPPPLKALALAHGRLWGAVGGKLYYSEEFHYEWFRPENFFPFPEEIVLVAPVNSGLFVNSLSSTWFVAGTVPGRMKAEKVGWGALPGACATVLVEGSGYEISRRFGRTPTPAWATRTGIVVGTHTGNLVHLTDGRLVIPPRSRGAALYLENGGQPLALFSLRGPLRGGNPPEIQEINSRNRLYAPGPLQVRVGGGVEIGGGGEYP